MAALRGEFLEKTTVERSGEGGGMIVDRGERSFSSRWVDFFFLAQKWVVETKKT